MTRRHSLSFSQAGFTFVELVISILIISIAMVSLMNAFGLSVSRSADPILRSKSLKIAQLYLDEALSKYYDHATPAGGIPAVANPSCASLGPEGSESRIDYNDVDDYHGISEAPHKQTGPLVGYDRYQVQVTVTCVGSDVGASSNSQVKKVLVIVTAPEGSQFTIASYKGNH